MNNKKRITLVSFLAYFVMSGLLTPMGIISGTMAEYFDQPVTEITARFGWLTFGVLGGAIIALFIFDLYRLKKILLTLYGVIIISIVSLLFLDDLFQVGVLMGLMGVCCAIGLAGGALVISRTYDTEQRASMLIITDSSFSIAGIICSMVAIYLIAQEYHWSAVYQFVALFIVVILFLSLKSTFPVTAAESRDTTATEKWPIAVWLCIVGLFLYTLGQWCFLLWLPTYAETELGSPRGQAGQLAGQFWTGMTIAQLFVAWWVLHVGVPRLVMLAGVTTSLFSIPLWIVTDIDVLIVLSACWGFANLGLLKVALSFATQMMHEPSARLVSTLLLGATLGTATSPWISSQIVAATNTHFVLKFGTACYVVLTILLLTACYLYRQKVQHEH
ncbi:MAG: MFS transporter TsgA [Woeseiaceae bacterium]